MTTPILFAFMVPTTSRGTNWKTIEDSYIFKILFRSVITSFSREYIHSPGKAERAIKYKFFFGIDEDDPILSKAEEQKKVENHLNLLPQFSVEFIAMKDIPKGHLTKMWNLLFQTAYDQGYDYFYICGDDIYLETPGWVNKSIQVLEDHSGIGITGPVNINGNTNIVTQTIMSRVHMQIFGYAYPEEIKNWYCDDWINFVYQPDYVFRIPNYKCHNLGGRERYGIVDAKLLCQQLVERDKVKLNKFLIK